jgi:maltose alpha-D-glucosyltransferase/alpha-amylase
MANTNNQIIHTENDPFWYKDAVIYQLHVKSYCDSNEDGIGDFKGLTAKLDYIQDLGVTAIWLLPFYPSPLRDDGYDISDYKSIHPAYGTLGDFKEFMKAAHRKGIRVITELVVNHTSDQHPWFQRARSAKPGSSRRNWYVWSDTPERYQEARVIFQDFESSNWAWDPVAKAYYWHRFYSHQPDLNYDNPQVQKAIFNVLNFWLNHGVDGLRMDAVPYLFEREGTNCENLPESHEFIKKIRAHIDKNYKNRMILAEANQWPEDAVAYFGDDDEFHMAFHFPLMPRLYMALRMEDAFPILDIMDQTPTIPDACQWAIFLRNHDELTLEMVTDEERDYMYRVYAQDPRMRLNLGIRRRLFPLLGNHRRRIELMNALLFSMPGTPIIYYGDELGMGDNIHLGDRDGVRTPMQWSGDRNAGFSRADPQALYLPVIISPEYHFEVTNAEVQQRSPHSMLYWMKRLIGLRKRFKAFSRGSIEFLRPENHRILAFLRRYGDETILVVANLSRYVQFVEFDLSAYQGAVPIELFGRMEFPAVGTHPYFLSLGPHSFYGFYLTASRPAADATKIVPELSTLPEIPAGRGWESLFFEPAKTKLEEKLLHYLKKTRWFGGKARPIKRIVIKETFTVSKPVSPACILLTQVDYMAGDAETYVLPVTYSEASQAEAVLNEQTWAAIAHLMIEEAGKPHLLHDALVDKHFCHALLNLISRGRRVKVRRGELLATVTKAFRSLKPAADEPLEPSILGAEQSNTSVLYGRQFILKLVRRLTPGVNPDLEIGRFLTEKKFSHTPPVAGAIEYRADRTEPMTLAILYGYVPNQGDAWVYTLEHLGHYFENSSARKEKFKNAPLPSASWIEQMDVPPPEVCFELIGTYLESVRLLGKRTARLHVCLASDTERPEFRPEPFSKLYQRSLYQSMRTLAARTFPFLRKHVSKFPEATQLDLHTVLDWEKDVLERFRSVLTHKISAMRIRCHGDFHLGQVLYTGKDFVIIDFEGEPARAISERRIKRSPMRDVAGMLRSFHYAAYSAFFAQKEQGLAKTAGWDFLEHCTNFWYRWVCLIFLNAYTEAAGEGRFLPQSREELQVLLDIFLLEKAIYELAYELNNRPDWVNIPLQGIMQLLQKTD